MLDILLDKAILLPERDCCMFCVGKTHVSSSLVTVSQTRI